MHPHDLLHQLPVREIDVMEDAAAQERVRQLLLRVGGDDHDGALLRFHCPLGLIDVELHLIQLPQQIVGELQIRLVNLVDQEHHLLLAVKSLPQLAQLDVMGDVIHALLAELPVIETLDGVIHVQPLLGLGGGLDVPYDQPLPKSLRHGLRQHGLARARLPLDQKRLLQRNRDIHAGHELLAGHIFPGSLKSLSLHSATCPFRCHPQSESAPGRTASTQFPPKPVRPVNRNHLSLEFHSLSCYDILNAKSSRNHETKENKVI